MLFCEDAEACRKELKSVHIAQYFRCSKHALELADFGNLTVFLQRSHAMRCFLERGSIVVSMITPWATLIDAGTVSAGGAFVIGRDDKMKNTFSKLSK